MAAPPNPAHPTTRPLVNPPLTSTHADDRATNTRKRLRQGAAPPSGRCLPAERGAAASGTTSTATPSCRSAATPSCCPLTGTGHSGPGRRLALPTSQDRSPAPVTSGSGTEAASCPRFPRASPRCRESPRRPRHRQLLAAQEKQKQKKIDKKIAVSRGKGRAGKGARGGKRRTNTSAFSQNRGAASNSVFGQPLSGGYRAPLF